MIFYINLKGHWWYKPALEIDEFARLAYYNKNYEFSRSLEVGITRVAQPILYVEIGYHFVNFTGSLINATFDEIIYQWEN